MRRTFGRIGRAANGYLALDARLSRGGRGGRGGGAGGNGG